jgi:hypothetical protein
VKSNASGRGLTFVEIMISATLLVVLLGMSLTIFMGFNTNMRDQMATVDLESQVVRVEKLLRSELKSVQGSSIILSDPGAVGRNTRIRYRPVTGFNAGTSLPTLGFVRQLEFRLDPGETNDNTSEDGDRYIDEGVLVLTVDVNADGIFAAAEDVVVATRVASNPEVYVAAGLPVGTNCQFRLGAGGATVYNDQFTTGFVEIDLTIVGAEPNNLTGVRLRTNTWRYAIRNP